MTPTPSERTPEQLLARARARGAALRRRRLGLLAGGSAAAAVAITVVVVLAVGAGGSPRSIRVLTTSPTGISSTTSVPTSSSTSIGTVPLSFPPTTRSTPTTTVFTAPETTVPVTATTVPVTATTVPHHVEVTDADNGQTITVSIGTIVDVVFSADNWNIQPSSNPAVLAMSGGPVQHQTQCIPGGTCGTTTAEFVAKQTGTATISATRTYCGEAIRCQPSTDTRTVGVTVTTGTR